MPHVELLRRRFWDEKLQPGGYRMKLWVFTVSWILGSTAYAGIIDPCSLPLSNLTAQCTDKQVQRFTKEMAGVADRLSGTGQDMAKTIADESKRWRGQLPALADQLKDASLHIVAALSDETACRMIQASVLIDRELQRRVNLAALIGIKQKLPPPTPFLCASEPATISFRDVPDSIRVSGFDLVNTTNPKVFLEYPEGRRVEIPNPAQLWVPQAVHSTLRLDVGTIRAQVAGAAGGVLSIEYWYKNLPDNAPFRIPIIGRKDLCTVRDPKKPAICTVCATETSSPISYQARQNPFEQFQCENMRKGAQYQVCLVATTDPIEVSQGADAQLSSGTENCYGNARPCGGPGANRVLTNKGAVGKDGRGSLALQLDEHANGAMRFTVPAHMKKLICEGSCRDFEPLCQ